MERLIENQLLMPKSVIPGSTMGCFRLPLCFQVCFRFAHAGIFVSARGYSLLMVQDGQVPPAHWASSRGIEDVSMHQIAGQAGVS
jgi:hypothetical protein